MNLMKDGWKEGWMKGRMDGRKDEGRMVQEEKIDVWMKDKM